MSPHQNPCARFSQSVQEALDPKGKHKTGFSMTNHDRSVATIYHCYSLERSLVPGTSNQFSGVKNLLPT